MAGIFGTHIGAWGTPDFGITEKISDILGSKRTYQGGSNLNPNTAYTQQGAKPQEPNSGRVISIGPVQGPQPAPTKQNAGTSGGGSNGGGGSAPQQNPGLSADRLKDYGAGAPADGWWWDAADGWKPPSNNDGGGDDSNQRLLDEINSAFDNVLGSLGGYQSTSEQNVRNAAQQQKAGIQEQQQYLINNLGQDRLTLEGMQAKSLADLAQNLRGQVKNVGRFIGSRGAGNSSASDQASAYLQKAFGQQRADVMNSYAPQFADVMKTENNLKAQTASMINEVDTWANSQIAAIADSYNQLRANIGLMKGQARIDAIAQLQAQLQSVQQQRDQYQLAIQEAARSRMAQLNDYKLQLQQTANFDPSQIVAQEFGFNPSEAYNTPEEFYYNPMALRRRDDRQLA